MSTSHLRDPHALTEAEIERIEKLCLRVLYQAVVDFGFEAHDVFRQSTDDEKDVAEDITRELLDRIGGYQIEQRVFGNVDYRKARYVVLPEFLVRQALFVDSKAEKDAASATIQMSQTSMRIHQLRSGIIMEETGLLRPVSEFNGIQFLTTTMLAHYHYARANGVNNLFGVTMVAIPNGKLQDLYNPDANTTIWRAGRNAPTRGESFRVRIDFTRLRAVSAWRVQAVSYDPTTRRINFGWVD